MEELPICKIKSCKEQAEGMYIVGGPQITDERDCCLYLMDGGTEPALVDAGLCYSIRAILAPR
ncbi:hypothetical protein [Desulfoscipio gibsoniae]|uniref:Uncharacterized protein n=1 Tax=Desulfoscipio gibsoniae DSM 7213 TaxID=767817 RepID=R4KL18_9FIRM|nr:hypothetical protein [Desulfoscipio gibsoniae]AGL01220.1 hypothetical protein Desgi_1769 [Desulfoscipio gibsoniae DSM 7213]